MEQSKPSRHFNISEMRLVSEIERDVRAPYSRVLVVPATSTFPLEVTESLSQIARKEVSVSEPSEINTHWVGDDSLAGHPLDADGLKSRIIDVIHSTGVLGPERATYRDAVSNRLDFMCTVGAAFHNDTFTGWDRSLFWVMPLTADGVEFIIPAADFRRRLVPGEMVIFDPCLPHAVCKVSDNGVFVSSSFESADEDGLIQTYLSGELPLTEAHWEALGCGWSDAPLPAGCIDLCSAVINERTGEMAPGVATLEAEVAYLEAQMTPA